MTRPTANVARAFDLLDELDLAKWRPALIDEVSARLSPGAHGDLAAWLDHLEGLPSVPFGNAVLDADAPGVSDLRLTDEDEAAVRASLLGLSPWRKGPFTIGPIAVDAEWQSFMKWRRLEPLLDDVAGARVLDVGCGNGYYALRLVGRGARTVIGIDPTLLYVLQFEAVRHFIGDIHAAVLPLRLSELPSQSRAFDVVLSMGVLYHTRAPIDHLRELRDALAPGGRLLLETLVLPGDEARSVTPEARYARMKNVWHLPSIAELTTWLARAGFRDVEVGDIGETSTDEQRATPWMRFESLAEAIDPNDPSLTTEGWPRPRRAVLSARPKG